jgi:hypothetical protein
MTFHPEHASYYISEAFLLEGASISLALILVHKRLHSILYLVLTLQFPVKPTHTHHVQSVSDQVTLDGYVKWALAG